MYWQKKEALYSMCQREDTSFIAQKMFYYFAITIKRHTHINENQCLFSSQARFGENWR
jgi:hypothetical protein